MRLLGGLRERLGAARLEVAAASVGELLANLVEGSGGGLAAVVYAAGDATPPVPHRDLRVLVNGRSIQFTGGLGTPLRDGDAVTVHLSGARGYPGG